MKKKIKVALITGGNSGIGKACAFKLAMQGYHVVVCARREKENIKVIDSIKSNGGEGSFVNANLMSSGDIKKIFDFIRKKFNRLDGLINNAGTDGDSFTKITDYPEEVYDQVMALNVKAVWSMMKYAIPFMVNAGGGSIVNIASTAGLRASLTGGAVYTASKHAVVGLTKSVAREFAADNIRVNTVCPAFVRTPMAEEILGEAIEEYSKVHPLGRICEIEEVADVVSWLCSDQSSFVTGVSIPVDGGVTS